MPFLEHMAPSPKLHLTTVSKAPPQRKKDMASFHEFFCLPGHVEPEQCQHGATGQVTAKNGLGYFDEAG